MTSPACGRKNRPGRTGGPLAALAGAAAAGTRARNRAGRDQVSWPTLFAAFLVCHLAGDLLLQTEWQALTKVRGLGDPEGRRALMAHATTYTLVYSPALAWIAADKAAGRAAGTAVLIAVPHIFIDDGRFVRGWLRQVKHSPEPTPSLRLMVDQSFHVVCLFGTAMMAAS
ncbi:MAG TPA: DUF3307 domain-containing protein [Solirubrobacteraceae bacterium]|nr:DUF3307 domain-containing protein [Solirubrobacteraceae bacterium]